MFKATRLEQIAVDLYEAGVIDMFKGINGSNPMSLSGASTSKLWLKAYDNPPTGGEDDTHGQLMAYVSGDSTDENNWSELTPALFAAHLVGLIDAGLTDIAGLAVTDGNIIVGNGTNWVAESGATARASLGVTIGTNVQAWDADLDAIAALAKADGNIIVGDGSTWVAESGATARTSLGLGAGDSPTFTALTVTDDAYAAGWNGSSVVPTKNALYDKIETLQPLDADLTSWAGVTRATGFDTFAATPSSANLKSLVTDETGSGGALVFATGPTITSPTIATSPTAAGATWTDLGTVTTADINGGTVDGAVIGGASAAAGTFTTLTATTIELGNTDTTLARSGSGVVTIEGVEVTTNTATQTLTNKTLTAPKIASGGFIADANGNEQIIFTTTASAVNEVTYANAATGNNPSFAATGGDANIGLDLQAKGSGTYRFLGTSTQAAQIRLYEDTDDGSNYTAFKVGTQAGDVTYTLPTAVGASGAVLTDAAGNGTLSWTVPAGTGDVTAASTFGTDNVLIRSDGTSKGVQSTGIAVDDSNNVTGVPSINSGPLAGLRNRLFNGSMRFWQRATASVGDDTYGFDRWNNLVQTAATTLSQLTDVENTTPYMMRTTQGQASAQRFGTSQIIEAVNCKGLRGQAVTLSARVRCSNSTTLRYAILEWTGTADSVTSDVVNDWTNGTFTAGNFFNSTTLTVTATGSTALTANTLTSVSLSTTLGSSTNNVIVIFWTDSTQAQNSTLDIGKVQFEIGSTATTFEFRPTSVELSLCERYYEKSYQLADAPGTSTTTGAFLQRAPGINVSWSANFKTRKRTTPTCTIYSTTGASGNMRDLSTNVDLTAQSTFPGESNFTIDNNASSTDGRLYGAHWVAESEL